MLTRALTRCRGRTPIRPVSVEFKLTAYSAGSGERSALVSATEHMAVQMQRELWGYLAIPTTRRTGGTLATSQILEIRDDAATLRQAWNAAAARFTGSGPTQEWLTARRRMWNYLRGAGVAVGTSQIVDIETTDSGQPLIGFLYHPYSASISANPFSWWVPANGGMDVMGGSAEGRAAMSPTMMLLHELDHKYDCINPGYSVCAGTTRGYFAGAEENTVRDVDASMRGHRDVAQRGWYGDVDALPGHAPHERQDRPNAYYFMGGIYAAVDFGDSLAVGRVNPQPWTGAWVRYPERETLLHGAAPTRPVASTAPVPRALTPPTPPAVTPPTLPPREGIDPRAVLPGTRRPSHHHHHRGSPGGRGLARNPSLSFSMLRLQRVVGNRAVARMQRDDSAMLLQATGSPAIAAPTIRSPKTTERADHTANAIPKSGQRYPTGL